jgi:hypothetical protein
MPIGMSRSVIGSVSALPALRAREAAIAPARPLMTTGFTSFSSVQIAETPIAPAPMKRTLRAPGRARVSPAAVVGRRSAPSNAARPSPSRCAPMSMAMPTHKPHQVTDREQRERKREIEPLTAPRFPMRKVLRDIAGEHLRGDDDRKDRGDD